MTALEERQNLVELLAQATTAGARQDQRLRRAGIEPAHRATLAGGRGDPSLINVRCGSTSRRTN